MVTDMDIIEWLKVTTRLHPICTLWDASFSHEITRWISIRHSPNRKQGTPPRSSPQWAYASVCTSQILNFLSSGHRSLRVPCFRLPTFSSSQYTSSVPYQLHLTLGILRLVLVQRFHHTKLLPIHLSSIARPYDFSLGENDLSFKTSPCDYHHRDTRHWEIHTCSNPR
jgi:hypothetical protein